MFELNVHFSTISRLHKAFQRIWQYNQPASQPQTRVTTPAPGPPHPTSSPPRSSETRPLATIGLHNHIIFYWWHLNAQRLPWRDPEAHFGAIHPRTITSCCEGDVLHCVRQMLVTTDTDRFSRPPPPQYCKTAHFRVAFYCGQPKAHLCNNHTV